MKKAYAYATFSKDKKFLEEVLRIDARHTGSLIGVDIEPLSERLSNVQGVPHAVMRLIGALADHGEDGLLSFHVLYNDE